MKIRKLGIILLATIITVTNMVVYANSADDSIIHSSDDVIKEYTKNKEMEKKQRGVSKKYAIRSKTQAVRRRKIRLHTNCIYSIGSYAIGSYAIRSYAIRSSTG